MFCIAEAYNFSLLNHLVSQLAAALGVEGVSGTLGDEFALDITPE